MTQEAHPTGIQTIFKWRDLLDLKQEAQDADADVRQCEAQIRAHQQKLEGLREEAKKKWAEYQKAYDEFPEDLE